MSDHFLRFIYQPKLTEIISDWVENDWGDKELLKEKIISWLPSEQSCEGSQRMEIEVACEGYNDCLREIKSRI